MKITKYIAALGISLLVMTACESDLEKITFNADTATAAALNIDGTAQDLYTLNANAGSETVFNLKWTKPDMGYPASLSNVLQIDLKDKNFSKASMVDAFTDATSYSFVTSNLNSNIQTLLKKYEMETQQVSVELRIASVISASADTVFSNVLTVNVMPYEGGAIYPEVYIIGSYSGWNFDSAQSLFSFNSDTNYEGIIDFGKKAAEGFKITGVKNWDDSTKNWGPENQDQTQEAEELSCIASGDSKNIICYSKRFYRFNFNTETLVLKKTMSFDGLYLVGSADGLGWDTASGKEMKFDTKKQCFYIDFEFTANSDIKLLTDTGLWLGDAGNGKVGDGGNIVVGAGKYRIYVNLNDANNQTYELNTNDYGI